jgi:hypothetical protein
VEVRTNYGSAVLDPGYYYRPPLLYAAEGKGAADGRLLLIDPGTGFTSAIGSGTHYSIDGLAMSPTGILYGVTRVASPATSALVQINTTTGSGSHVADLRTDTNGRVDMVDIDFMGSTLVGFAQNFRRPCTIDPNTGLVTLMSFVDFGSGEAIAVDALSDVYLLPRESDDDVWMLDSDTGISSIVAGLSGPTSTNGFFNAGTFLNGVCYVCEAERNPVDNSEPNGLSRLLALNPATGVLSSIATLSFSDVDALAGTFK